MATPIDVRPITFRPDAETLAVMERMKNERGVPYSVQIKRALAAWFASEGAVWLGDAKQPGARMGRAKEPRK